MANEYSVEMKGISKSFGRVQAVIDVDLELRRGEILGLVGDNGAGKSTLMKLLSGMCLPDQGEIWIHGKKAAIQSPLDARSYGIEMIYQDLALFENLDITSNVFIGRELRRSILGLPFLDKRRMRVEVERILDRLNIGIESTELLVGGLSGGQRQCVAIGRALSFEASVMIMDEPSAALGVKESSTVLKIIESLRDHGISVIMISHRIPDILAIGDRVMIMKGGRRVGVLDVAHCTLDDCVDLIVRGATAEQSLNLSDVSERVAQ